MELIADMPCEFSIAQKEPWAVDPLSVAPTNEAIERVEARLLSEPQIECPLTHRFAPGVYLREIFMPKGAFIIGQEHRTKHLNIILQGKAAVMMDGVMQIIEAPDTFISEPGVRKVLYILEDMIWQTVHPTDETDLKKLEELLIIKSQTFLSHEEQMRLREFMP